MFETSFNFKFVTFRCLQQVWEFDLVHHNEFWSFYFFNTQTSSQWISLVLWAARLGLSLPSHSPISNLILFHVAMFYLMSAYYTEFHYDFPQCVKTSLYANSNFGIHTGNATGNMSFVISKLNWTIGKLYLSYMNYRWSRSYY